MKKKLLFFLFLLMLYGTGWGQELSIQSQLIDTIDRQPLVGVGIGIKGSAKVTLTNKEGRFTLTASPQDILVFSYIGYQTREIAARLVAGMPAIEMVRKDQKLAEVVVVGYGVQRKVSSVGSITAASGNELLSNGNMNSVSEALQGRLNGVVAINSTGKPGSNTAAIYIRGKASWNTVSPLVLVDGIERNMNDIDMNEIESVSVLKDASATAVYGVRGANGVILVTTKRGTNQRAKVSFTAGLGLKQPTARLKWADYVTSMDMWNEAAANDKQWDKLIPQSTIDAWENAYATGNYGPYNEVFPEVDWYKEMLRKVGISQNYNLNVRGGSEKMNYFFSIGSQNDGDIYKIEKQKDFDPRNYFKRYNWRSNFDFKVSRSTVVSINVAGKMGYINETGGLQNYTFIIQAPRNVFPIKYSNGYWGDSEELGYNILSNVSERGQRIEKQYQGWYDFSIKQKLDGLVKGLSAKVAVSYNQFSGTESLLYKGGIQGRTELESRTNVIRYFKKYDYANPIIGADGQITYPLIREVRLPNVQTSEDLPVQASYDNLIAAGRRLYYELSLGYDRKFGDHRVTGLALVNRQVIENKVSGANKMEFPAYTEDWVSRVTYGWKDRYLAELNMSYTGSEKFAPGKRFGFFPSFSAGWRVSEEPFIRKFAEDYLTNLKIRYSYGKVGSDFGAPRFNYIQLYNSSGNIVLGNTQAVNFGPLYTEGSTANPYSTWEIALKQNIGVELELWNKLEMTLDLFDEQRTGILMTPRTTASWFGTGLPSINMGATKNHGLELGLGWTDRLSSGLRYWAKLNVALSENRIVDRDDPSDLAAHLKDAGKPIDWQSRYLAVGNYGSIDDVYNYAQTAIAGATPGGIIPGDLVYIDYNGDGIIEANDRVAVAEKNYPLTTYALDLGFSYKGFEVGAMLYAPLGVYKLQFDQFLWDFPVSTVKAQPNTLDRWTPETANSSGVIRPATHFVRNHNNVQSTFKYSDYSYLRLKNVRISYDLPRNLLDPISMSNCQVYITGNNLLTWSKVDSRVDPETGVAENYPIVRTYTIGIRASF
ncbi:MAG: TonB-dependent receptor [Candidatus Pseudobacter hemicellulosilyticus]|uniref:TonB-dependent receptor n=1 Tax=Candidatus Pseudobacter hemicellulosilyticus TaxID=3121375 RepID=A0AAJ6BI06_9BACT|nr:MAG: TonB-dependent receptor [Pseudobacter sp.]